MQQQPVSPDGSYKTPQKEINNINDMEVWKNSEAYHEYVGFVTAMNNAVRGKTLQQDCHVSETTQKMVELLDTLNTWISEIPPIDQPQRFGNKAFQTWFNRLKENADEILQTALPQELHPAIVELSTYLVESVGNYIRIDYGTGHEMAFAMFLCCLFKIGALKEEDSVAAINRIFSRYIEVMRNLQVTYRMEPAGSHGAWSLDDYQFLPFIWGSSQLIRHPRLEPHQFPIKETAEAYAQESLFMSCINFIHQVKTGPFAEHSNQLWNISGAAGWQKINQGLIKMYKAEVLSKFPVIQHTKFGNLLPIKPHGGLQL